MIIVQIIIHRTLLALMNYTSRDYIYYMICIHPQTPLSYIYKSSLFTLTTSTTPSIETIILHTYNTTCTGLILNVAKITFVRLGHLLVY